MKRQDALRALAIALVVGAGGMAKASDYVWTNSAGGAQSWTAGANWVGGSVPDPVAGDTVDLSTVDIAADTTLTLGADRTAATWKFGDTAGAQSWIVENGNSILLAGAAPTISVAQTAVTLSNLVNGAAGFTKSGAGTLTLSAANTYAGGTTNSAGTLRLTGGDNRLPTGTTIAFTGSSTLNLDGVSQSLTAITFPNTTLTAAITGSGGALTVNGPADLQIGPGGSLGGTTNITLNMSGLGRFIFNASTNAFRVGLKSGSANTGALGVVATATLAGTNTLCASLLGVGDVVASNDGGGSALYLGQTNLLKVGSINIGAGSRSDATNAFAAGLTSPAVTIRNIDGSSPVGAWTVGSVNQPNSVAQTAFSALVDFSPGSLDASVTNMTIGIADIGAGTGRAGTENAQFRMGAGALTVEGALTIGAIRGTGTVGAKNLAASGTFTLNNASGTLIASTLSLAENTITDTAYTRTVTGTFNLTDGTLEAGTVQKGVQTGTATATVAFNWANGTFRNLAAGDLNITGVPITLLSGTHTFSATGAQSITVDANSPISGTGGLTKTGGGTLTLGAVNPYTGATTISDGALVLGATGRLTGSTSITVTGGTLHLTADTGLSSNAVLALSGGAVNVDSGKNQSVRNLFLGGQLVQAGTWGRTGSPAANQGAQYDAYFSGGGILTVSEGGPPAAGTGGGATDIVSGMATLRGVLASGSLASAWICWGRADGGTGSPGAWEHAVSMGTVSEGLVFSNTVSGVYYGVLYRYRVYVTNGLGENWSAAGTFATPAPTTLRISTTNDAAGVSGQVVYDNSSVFGVTQWHVKNNGATSATTRKGYVRFGTSSIQSAVTNAALELTISTLGITTARDVSIYGITNQALDAVALTNGLPWASAPANDAASPYAADLTKAKLLGSLTVQPSNTAGTVKSFTSQALIDLLNADTNDRVTFILGRSVQDGNNLLFAGDTHATYAPPTLRVDMDSALYIGSTGVTDIKDASANLRGVLVAPQSAFAVAAYWSTNNNADAAAWLADGTAGSMALGSYTNGIGQPLTAALSGLTRGATYYCTMMATNEATNLWALPNVSFTTDGTAPAPSPMTFSIPPLELNATTIVMLATTATDALNGPVQYFFENTTNSDSSGWISISAWTNSGLTTGTTHGYRVKARDAVSNETDWSAVFDATAQDDLTPPAPSPMTWALAPVASGETTITMEATAATDPNGPMLYYFENTNDLSNSGWTTNTVWVSAGLTPGELYGYRVRAQDGLGNLTDWSAVFVCRCGPLAWDANATGAGQTDGAGSWLSSSQWWNGATNVSWNGDFTNSAVIGNGGTGGAITLGEIMAGSVMFTNFSGTYTLSGGSLTNSAGITIATNAGSVTINTPMTGAGGVTKRGSGTLQLNNTSNSFAGDVVLYGGTLNSLDSGCLGAGTNLVVAGSSSVSPAYGVYPTCAQGVIINSGATATFSVPTQYFRITFAGPLAGSGTVYAVGSAGGAAGACTFSSAYNTFTGTLQCYSGGNGAVPLTVNSLPDSPNPIRLNGAANPGLFALGAGAAMPLVFNSRRIELYGTGGGYVQNNNATATNTITINTDLLVSAAGNRTLTLGGGNAGTNVFGGAITNGPGTNSVISLTKAEAGRWVLSGTNTYTGGTAISAGTLEIGGSGALGGGDYAGAITNGATLRCGSSADQTLRGVIRGAGTILKTGTGTLTLAGANTYTGATRVNAGTLRLGADNTLGESNNVVLAGGALEMGGYTNSLGTLSVTNACVLVLGAGALGFRDSSATAWAGTLTVFGELGPHTVRFGTSSTALTLGQVGAITCQGYSVFLDADGYLRSSRPTGLMIIVR